MNGSIFRVELLPAREGDCIWLTYGSARRPRHVLIDGGRKATEKLVRKRIEELAADGSRLELIVVTHIDRDHIEGILSLLQGGVGGLSVGDIWFNGYDHLLEVERAGVAQGELLTAAIEAAKLPWNRRFGGGAVVAPDHGALPRIKLSDGAVITLLSPTRAKLSALEPIWRKECARAGLSVGRRPTREPGGLERQGALSVEALAAQPFKADTAVPNGSSIAFLFEFEGRRVLFAADAHAPVLEASLPRLGNRGPLKLDALKVAHHASAANTSSALLRLIDCNQFLISTNGAYFTHPDAETIARILKSTAEPKRLSFNYRSAPTVLWDDPGLTRGYGYSTDYESGGAPGFSQLNL